MSKPQNILVAAGAGEAKLPKQNYERIFTEYNIAGTPVPDAQFYNSVKSKRAMEGVDEFDIYGFLPGGCSYSNSDSVSVIVNFFDRHPLVGVVVCDMLLDYGGFKSYRYIHPESANNIPFFVNKSVVDQLNFEGGQDSIFKNQLETLKQSGHIIFHIAKPLLILKK